MKNNSSIKYPMDVLNRNFIRLGLTRAKALQTASRFPRETRHRFAVPKSNAFALAKGATALKKNMIYEIVPAGMEKHRQWRNGED
jgi:hypothetical protein